MQGINIVDIVVGSVVVLSLVFGVMRGMIHTVFAVAGYVAAFYGTNAFAPKLSPLLNKLIADQYASRLASYIIVFLCIFALMKWLNVIAAKFIKFIGLTGFDKAMGGIIGLAKGVVIASIALSVVELFFPGAAPYIKQAKSGKVIQPIADTMRENLPRYIDKIKKAKKIIK